jgi:hypothetical protein
MKRLILVGLGVAALFIADASRAAVVASSLPYDGTPDWRTVILAGTTMDYTGSSTVLTTAQGQGVWFGHTPGSTSWGLGSNADGNKVRLSASFSSNARDWNTYLADGFRFAGMLYNPTGCDGNAVDCTFAPFATGVTLSFAGAANGSGNADLFVALDTTAANQFGFELKDNLVRYRINNSYYTGFAQSANYNILVIGDGSGSTRTGWGSMTVRSVSFDNGPIAALNAVPEPASWAMMLGGFGLLGGVVRRKAAAAIA